MLQIYASRAAGKLGETVQRDVNVTLSVRLNFYFSNVFINFDVSNSYKKLLIERECI